MIIENTLEARNAAQVLDSLDLDIEPHKTFLRNIAKSDLYVANGVAIPYQGKAMIISPAPEDPCAFDTSQYILHRMKQEALSKQSIRTFLYTDGGPLKVLNTYAERPSAVALATIVLAGRGSPAGIEEQNLQSGLCAVFDRYNNDVRRRLRGLFTDVCLYRVRGKTDQDIYEVLAQELHLGRSPTR